MRLLTILFCFISVLTKAQADPFTLDIVAEEVEEKTFHLKCNFSLHQGWYVYAEDSKALEIEGLKFSFDSELAEKAGALLFDRTPATIQDKIFETKLKSFSGKVTLLQKIIFHGVIPEKFNVRVTGFASNGSEFLPISVSKELVIAGGLKVGTDLLLENIQLSNPLSHCGNETQRQDSGLLTLFLIGFGGGLLALLTPCIFPLIPVTVSYFTGKAKTKQQGITNALLYGFSILFIYALASGPFHFIGNIDAQVFNTISTNAGVNIFFFVVFLLFALSFFGLFTISLPYRLQNVAGTRTGIFFLALTLVIVSFSCTGIILGSLLVTALSENGTAWQLTAGMTGFGLALGLPFGFFAMFPQWLKKLPKSGGWMDTFKVSLAFVELGLAVKFLSNADLVEHWGLLKREVFIGAWILIALALAIYLFNISWWIKYRKFNLSPLRLMFGFLTLAFALYMIPGTTSGKHANLSLLSGFAPPLSYSIYGKDNIKNKGLEPDVINDYDKALQLSKEQNKPLLVDFTGWACVNCRKMEEQVWTKPEIASLIKDKFILVSLYVDDRKKLPAIQHHTFKFPNGKEKDIETLGDKWATFQELNFQQVTQPLYVILSPDEKLLNNPVGYTPDVNEYKAWLQCGLDAHNANK